MERKSFFRLIEELNGFEYAIAFNDQTVYLGGVGNKCWYFLDKGVYDEYYVATFIDGEWNDWFYVSKEGNITREQRPSGTTASLIVKQAYINQGDIPDLECSEIVVKGHECLHYEYPNRDYFDVLKEYGITVASNDTELPYTSFRFWDLFTGRNVSVPTEL